MMFNSTMSPPWSEATRTICRPVWSRNCIRWCSYVGTEQCCSHLKLSQLCFTTPPTTLDIVKEALGLLLCKLLHKVTKTKLRAHTRPPTQGWLHLPYHLVLHTPWAQLPLSAINDQQNAKVATQENSAIVLTSALPIHNVDRLNKAVQGNVSASFWFCHRLHMHSTSVHYKINDEHWTFSSTEQAGNLHFMDDGLSSATHTQSNKKRAAKKWKKCTLHFSGAEGHAHTAFFIRALPLSVWTLCRQPNTQQHT